MHRIHFPLNEYVCAGVGVCEYYVCGGRVSDLHMLRVPGLENFLATNALWPN